MLVTGLGLEEPPFVQWGLRTSLLDQMAEVLGADRHFAGTCARDYYQTQIARLREVPEVALFVAEDEPTRTAAQRRPGVSEAYVVECLKTLHAYHYYASGTLLGDGRFLGHERGAP